MASLSNLFLVLCLMSFFYHQKDDDHTSYSVANIAVNFQYKTTINITEVKVLEIFTHYVISKKFFTINLESNQTLAHSILSLGSSVNENTISLTPFGAPNNFYTQLVSVKIFNNV